MNKIIVTQTRGYSGKENYPNSIEESVATNVATLLYNLGKDDDLNQTLTYGVDTTDSNRPVTSIKGNIKVPATYSNYLEYFEIKYPELKISATNTYIYFEDPKVEEYLINYGIGDGTGITLADAETANFNDLFNYKTDITSFNSFKYFIRMNTLPPQYSNVFEGCSNLTSIDLSRLQKTAGYAFTESGITTINAPMLQELSSQAFKHCSKLTTIENLGEILIIPYRCFGWDSNLQSVIIPATCSTIDGYGFVSCTYLTDIVGLSNVVSIGGYAFSECPLSNVNILDLQNLTTIGVQAFKGSQLSGVLDLPKLISLGDTSFYQCTRITKIKSLGIISAIPNYSFSMVFTSSGGSLTEVCLPYECTQLGSEAFKEQKLLTTVKQYAKSINEYGEDEVKTYRSNLSKITIFGQECFYDCITLPLTTSDIINATSIGKQAFYKVPMTGNVSCPNLTSLGQSAFEETNISSINLSPNTSITALNGYTFKNCKQLTSITFPSTLTILGPCEFQGCSALTSLDLSNIDLQNSTLFNANGAFSDCSALTTLGVTSFPGITSLKRRTFMGCSSLTGTLSFPNATEAVCSGNDGGIFNNSGIQKIVLGHVETLIGTAWSETYRGLASNCLNLKIVDLGDSLTSLGKGNFHRDTNLKAVIIRNTTPPTIANTPNSWGGLFGNNDVILYVPASAVSTYLSATWFSTYGDANHIKSIENDYNESQILGS